MADHELDGSPLFMSRKFMLAIKERELSVRAFAVKSDGAISSDSFRHCYIFYTPFGRSNQPNKCKKYWLILCENIGKHLLK